MRLPTLPELIRAGSVVVLVLFASGCVYIQTGSNQAEHERERSVAEQLIELHEAREVGAISEEEHAILKKRLIGVDDDDE